MSILIFSPLQLTPELNAGSKIRMYNIGKYFQSKGYKVHFVYYADNGINWRNLQFMHETWDTFTLIHQKKLFIQHSGNYEKDEHYETHIADHILDLVSLFDIRLVWCNYIFQSAFLEALPEDVHKVIDTHDVFTNRYELFLDQPEVTYKWYSFSKEDEAAALDRADTIVAITSKEQKYFQTLTQKPVTVVSHIENKQFINKEILELKTIGFIGGGNDVNIVAINHFLKKFYQLSEHHQTLDIVIAGQICDHIQITHPRLHLWGKIPSVHQFYQEVDLVINPLMFGTGLKIKSIEALSFGVPIISTRIGFEGIESRHAYHQCDNIEILIQNIDHIKKNPAVLTQMQKESCHVFEHYEKTVYTNIDNILGNIFTSKDSTSVKETTISSYRAKAKSSWILPYIYYQYQRIQRKLRKLFS